MCVYVCVCVCVCVTLPKARKSVVSVNVSRGSDRRGEGARRGRKGRDTIVKGGRETDGNHNSKER